MKHCILSAVILLFSACLFALPNVCPLATDILGSCAWDMALAGRTTSEAPCFSSQPAAENAVPEVSAWW